MSEVMQVIGKIYNFLSYSTQNQDYGLKLEKNNFLIYAKGDNNPLCLLEICAPTIPPDHSKQLEQVAEKARTLSSSYFITWNLRDTILWRTPKKGTSVTREYRIKNYPTIHQIPQTSKPILNPSLEALLRRRTGEIIADLKKLKEEGHLYLVDIDAIYFVHRLHQAVEKMTPLLKKSLSTHLYLKPQFKKEVYDWAVKQGITNYEKEEFLESLSRQIVYRLLGKIIFYESLRRHLRELPEPDFSSLD